MSDLHIENDMPSSSEPTNDVVSNEPVKDIGSMSAEPSITANDDDEDLEDGEIDDDDDDDNTDDVKIITASGAVPPPMILNSASSSLQSSVPPKIKTQVVIDLSDDRTVTPPPVVAKSKKGQPLEDDHASSIENALANALKKRGIDPPMPKIESTTDANAEIHVPSRSSRRRKRKKLRESKDLEKERQEKKTRFDSSEAVSGGDEEDMDEYEMLNVRGGSPPPSAAAPTSTATTPTTQFANNYMDNYDSEESDSSYDSYDSTDATAAGGNADRRRRQATTQRRDVRKRRDRNPNQREKRNRRDSIDEKHQRPQEPRKLELCKFYLMECCAKKEKCSYMHSDFPCKFYYLGMECTLGDECKFGHGEPLNEQLRNILLKHLETAPKEILGNFKRISRDQAVTLLNKRHGELCSKFGVENTWTSSTTSALLLNPTSAGSNNNINNNNNNNNNNNRRNAMNLQSSAICGDLLHQQMALLNANTNAKIPSLLDMIINPPLDVGNNKMQDNKQRKSRWAGDTDTDTNTVKGEEDVPSQSPSYLDLSNLTGILSRDHIEKLTQMGISNLEQVNQLTFGQLNQIGLTITEISEIQAKLQGKIAPNTATSADSNDVAPDANITQNKNDGKLPTKITSAATTSKVEANTCENNSSSNKNEMNKIKETTGSVMSSNLNILKANSNSSGATQPDSFDYTQYLRDSNLNIERLESCDDEKDDEKLVIDDGNMETDEGGHTPVPSSGDEVKSDSDAGTVSNSSSRVNNSRQQSIATGFYSAQRNNPFRSYVPPVDSEMENRERSHTPTRSQSSTPEATESPDPDDMSQSNYERATIYDYNPVIVAQEEVEADRAAALADTENRLNADSLQLPFAPVANFTPATEIEGSITSYLPVPYKVFELDLERPSYRELRKQSKPSDLISDPRLRRILGLQELRSDTPAETNTQKSSQRGLRTLSNNIASPDSEGASPKYYIPPSSSHYTEPKVSKSLSSLNITSTAATTETMSASTITSSSSNTNTNIGTKNSSTATAAPSDPRSRQMDPRRAAAAAKAALAMSDAKESANTANSASAAMKQTTQIRNLLQQSEWYKNLNSKVKIMVNQQLTLVSTELKKFHQNTSPQKIFDISFILSNMVLQQILSHLGIYIDDNGEVAYLDGDNAEQQQLQQLLKQQVQEQQQQNSNGRQIHLPNLSQPPPDFLRGPPPNLTAPPPNLAASLQNLATTTQLFRPALNMTPFGVMPPNARPSLLGLPPAVGNVTGGNAFNPFSADLPSAAFAAGLIAPGHLPFANFGGGPPNGPNAGIMLSGNMRNFGNNNNNNNNPNAQRNGNRNNRRNKI